MTEAAPRTRDPRAGMLHRIDGFLASVAYYPPVLAAYVILQAYVNNLGEVPAEDVLITLVIVVAATIIAFGLVSQLFGDARRAAVPVAFATIVILGFGYVEDALAPHWSGGAVLLLVGALAAIILVGIAAYRATRLTAITQALNVVSVLLLLVAMVPIVAFASETMRAPASLSSRVLALDATDITVTRDPGSEPRDIYYIVLDRYGSEQALAAGPGIDNAEFIGWLREHGFQVVDDARSNYASSLPSIGSTLSMSLLDGIAAELGPGSVDYAPMLELVRRSRAAAVLQSLGYEYIHVGSWFPATRHSLIADRSFASAQPSTFPSAILRDSAAGIVAEALGLSETAEKVHAAAAEYQFGVLRSLLDEPGPQLVVAHVLMPHEPFVFTEDGTFDPGAATFQSQLEYTNREVRTLIEPLLSRPEAEQPIIILQADEGPYPERYAAGIDAFDWTTATEEELIIKFGILEAMYLPGPEGAAPLPEGMSSVNTFREVLTRYFGAGLPNLPDRSFGASQSHPYDLAEVTDRFPIAVR